MRMLARPIGLGLAARGDVDDVTGWARRARDQGLDSIWIHDSYFERDGVSFTTAIAQAIAADDDGDEAGFRVALGAANPFTRHPVVLAMTGSALDEILPGRFVLGIGTGLPLRLKQMGIPYEPDAAVESVSKAMDDIRALWAGERLPSATPGLPPIQPMFPPPHRIPLVVAAYRRQFVELAGRKADGYLARPAESIPSLRGILERLRAAATDAGRDPQAIETAGYLLSLVDTTRREALNRAKREPFVIYMMSVLSDISLRRAGFDTRPSGPDRGRVARRGLHHRRQPDPRRAARRVHAVRHARGGGRRGDGVPRPRRARPAAAPAGPPGGPPDRRADRRRGPVRGPAGARGIAGRRPPGRRRGRDRGRRSGRPRASPATGASARATGLAVAPGPCGRSSARSRSRRRPSP